MREVHDDFDMAGMKPSAAVVQFNERFDAAGGEEPGRQFDPEFQIAHIQRSQHTCAGQGQKAAGPEGDHLAIPKQEAHHQQGGGSNSQRHTTASDLAFRLHLNSPRFAQGLCRSGPLARCPHR